MNGASEPEIERRPALSRNLSFAHACDCQGDRRLATLPRAVRPDPHALTLCCALLLAPFGTGLSRAETAPPSLRHSSFRAAIDLRAMPEADPEPVHLRQSLFKRPAPPASVRRAEPEIRRAIAVPNRTPSLPPRPMPSGPIPAPRFGKSMRPSHDVYRELGVVPTSFTPYDRYMGDARQVLEETSSRNPATLAVACRLVEKGRKFRYVSRDPYRPDLPDTTAQRKSGDCKSKALWLYQQLNDPTALYVIGKAERGAKSSHAWLYWYYDERWWILDPTTRSTPVAVSSIASGRYVPYYSFGRYGAYRHGSTRLYGSEEDTPEVAARRVLFLRPKGK